MVMVDLGIPPGFELLSEDLNSYRESNSASKKSGRLEKVQPDPDSGDSLFRIRSQRTMLSNSVPAAGEVSGPGTQLASRVYEYYDPAVNAQARPVRLEVRKK